MGKKFYHKGDITKRFEEDQQPRGWIRGRSEKSKIESCKKRKRTCLEKYGVENPAQSVEVKGKMKQTNLERYGVENPMQSGGVREKMKRTCLERYGVESPTSSPVIKDKTKQTNLERYGVEYSFQSEEVKEKVKKANLEKYGVEYPTQSREVQEKVKRTNLERYGVEYPAQSVEVKGKMKQTNLERYGVGCSFQSGEVKEKIKKVNLEKYGVENPAQSVEVKGKMKQTNLERYGVENPAQSREVQDKVRQTNLEKYHTQWFCNTPMCTSSKKNPNHSYPNNSFKYLLDSRKINYVEEFPIDDLGSGISYRYDFKVGNYLIEIDSKDYHNSYKSPFNKPKDKFYHQKKSKFAYSHGFVCIHIFDWNDPEEVLSSILRGSLEVSGFVEPRLFLYNSKDDKVIKYSDGLDVSSLVEEGYLPVYDDGVVLKDK